MFSNGLSEWHWLRIKSYFRGYNDSSYIKSMKYNDEKGFSSYSKVISDLDVEELVEYTKKHIEEKTKEIVNGDFKINPKYYDGKNISCEFCTYKDLCFYTPKDINYLEKVEDVSFLGDDE